MYKQGTTIDEHTEGDSTSIKKRVPFGVCGTY